MGVISWALDLGSKFLPRPVGTLVGLARKVLRGIISAAIKMDESLPDIKLTMDKLDPGKSYGEWASQYRTQVQGLSKEKALAMWPDDLPFNESVFTVENLRRANKYRYIFAVNVTDTNVKEGGWRMFSLYSDDLMSPREVVEKYWEENFRGRYENQVDYKEYSFYRVQVWDNSKK